MFPAPASASAKATMRRGDSNLETAQDREKLFMDALRDDAPHVDLPIALETSFFRLDDKDVFVPITAKLPSSVLELGRTAQSPPRRPSISPPKFTTPCRTKSSPRCAIRSPSRSLPIVLAIAKAIAGLPGRRRARSGELQAEVSGPGK